MTVDTRQLREWLQRQRLEVVLDTECVEHGDRHPLVARGRHVEAVEAPQADVVVVADAPVVDEDGAAAFRALRIASARMANRPRRARNTGAAPGSCGVNTTTVAPVATSRRTASS